MSKPPPQPSRWGVLFTSFQTKKMNTSRCDILDGTFVKNIASWNIKKRN